MAATARDLQIPQRAPLSAHTYGFRVKAGARLYKSAIVGITAATLAVPAGTAGCVALIGLAELNVDNRDGADGDQLVNAKKGVFRMSLTAAPANIGAPVYALDDQTLQLTNAGGELRLGVIDAIDDEGVWVRI